MPALLNSALLTTTNTSGNCIIFVDFQLENLEVVENKEGFLFLRATKKPLRSPIPLIVSTPWIKKRIILFEFDQFIEIWEVNNWRLWRKTKQRKMTDFEDLF